MQPFEEIMKILDQWLIQIMVILSLFFQMILTILGSRRKYTARFWIWILVWLAYLLAGTVATAALGYLGKSDSDRSACLSADRVATATRLGSLARGADSDGEEKYPKSNCELQQLQAFWVSFLLIHLGGPDTITAYALEDNELGLRQFPSLITQGLGAIIVYLRFWRTDMLTFTATPILVAGTVKYAERAIVLYSSSKANFKKFSLKDLFPPIPDHISLLNSFTGQFNSPNPLDVVCYLLQNCARLFSSQILDDQEERASRQIFEGMSEKDCFNLVAFELGFMYDLLYTKAKIIYSVFGISARCFSFLSSLTALVLFSIFIDIPAYPLVDIIITYLLLIGAIFTDLYGFILHLFSDWTKFTLERNSFDRNNLTDIFGATFYSHPLLSNHKRWSRSMGQLNLISYCVKDETITAKSAAVGKLLATIKTLVNLENQWYVTWADVSDELEELICRELKEKVSSYTKPEPFFSTPEGQSIMTGKGDYVLKKRYGLDPETWLIASERYDYSLLAWHIATDLCYYDDLDEYCHGDADKLHPRCKISKCLSDYMLYLLVVCPSLMPEENFMDSRYANTCQEINDDYRAWPLISRLDERTLVPKSKSIEARWHLLRTESRKFRQNPQSASRPGRQLGKRLQEQESEVDWSNGRKWDMISEVWVEMLAYAASHGTWNEHGQHLRNGGELLTHVRLLMAHLGLSSQYDKHGIYRDVLNMEFGKFVLNE